ncbi:MAG: bifunctional diaminohydroxyphosphoribosylaminopyrimidine deaminase/5-amino-6-(5-phosphoribosylamino)uracil reductase RibD [Actinobacteria bacterium]|nr:bifunctional diaminohydroxyphosphoribosylaminopyrimidine deaminase/5-amino-6-(5-phosphoribosylamino)uracil reductase RibD [Actinomycetota bacterium]
MLRALRLAERGSGLAAPNPPVGAVVVLRGEVVGEGWHRGPGTPHAEVVALRAAGERARGATVYTTLEPCSHAGRTGPCTEALVEAGVSRVVAATTDPNPLVDGRGFARLREAGIDVEVGTLSEEAERLIEGFARHVRTGLPFVTLKLAATLDGKVAARDGSSRWITGEESRREVHRMRAASGAIAVGAGTALADDPSLTVRLEGSEGRPPLRVVVDATGRVPAAGALFTAEAPTLVATTARSSPGAREAWRAAGAEVLVLAEAEGGVALDELVGELGKREVQRLLVEGGPTLGWSAVRADLVDRLVLFLAPVLAGGDGAPGILGGEGVASIGEALAVEIESVERIGPDLKVEARVQRDG